MRKILQLLFFLLIHFITIQSIQAQVVSHSVSQEVTQPAVACENDEFGFTFDNSYWRSYVLSDFGITGPHALTGVQFGYSYENFEGNAPAIDVTIRAYTSDAPFPNGSLTEIATGTAEINETGSLTVLDALFETPININDNEEIIIEIFFPDTFSHLVQIRAGQNQAGETAPSYFSTLECGGFDFITFDDIGFPGNVIINMIIDNPLSVNEFVLPEISFFPNPVVDTLTIKIPSDVEVQSIVLYDVFGKKVMTSSDYKIDVSDISKGIYFINVETDTGSFVKKIVKS